MRKCAIHFGKWCRWSITAFFTKIGDERGILVQYAIRGPIVLSDLVTGKLWKFIIPSLIIAKKI